MGFEVAGKSGFGNVRRLPSGRWQASYDDPDGRQVLTKNGRAATVRHNAPHTFDTKGDAQGWLGAQRSTISAGTWVSPEAERAAKLAAEADRLPTFGEYATLWLDTRKVSGGRPLQDSTRRGYEIWQRRYILPTFGAIPLDEITPAMVIKWLGTLPHDKPKTVKETVAHAKAVMRSATSANGVMPGAVNPFAIDGIGYVGKKSRWRTEVLDERDLEAVMSTIRPEWAAMVALGLGCGMRFGEVIALRRSDIDLAAKGGPVIRIRRAVGTGTGGKRYEKAPKSEAGVRDQRIPTSALPVLRGHLNTYVTGKDGLLFPSPDGVTWLRETRFRQAKGGWNDVRVSVGRDVGFHDLRRTGATRLAQQGANPAEIQKFLGDSTREAAERYVAAVRSRMDTLTEDALGGLSFGVIE